MLSSHYASYLLLFCLFSKLLELFGCTFIGHDTSKCNLTKYTDVFNSAIGFHLWFIGRPQTGLVNVTDVFILLSNSTRSCTGLLRLLSPRHVIEQFPGQFSYSNFKVVGSFPSFKGEFYMMKGDNATFLMCHYLVGSFLFNISWEDPVIQPVETDFAPKSIQCTLSKSN